MTDTNIAQVEPADVPEGARIIDVRQPEEFQAGHVPGAISIPMRELRDRSGEIPHEEAPVYFMCKGGTRSQAAAEFFAQQGVEVANIAGGATAWHQAGKPMVSETGEEPAVVPPMAPPPMEV